MSNISMLIEDDYGRVEYDYGSNVLNLHIIRIKQEYRRQGHGTRMIRALKQQYNVPIILQCHINIKPFYDKLGFVQECETYDGYIEMILY